MKIELKGFVKEVLPIQTVGANNTKKQTLVFFVPGYTDNFGEKIGRDEFWPLDVMGDKIDKLNLSDATHARQKAIATVYVSGNAFDKSDGTGKGYAINANLGEIKILGSAAQTTTPATNTSSKTDDLPW